MENLTTRILLTGIFFMLMLGFGILLSRKGKPYSKMLFTFHKIFTLATIVFMVLLVIRIIDIDPLMVTMIWISGTFLVISFVSGVILSFEKPLPNALVIIHRISSLLLAILTVATIYLILR